MGSTLRCLVMDSFCKITTVDIDVETIDRFSKVVQPIYEHIYKINKMNKNLIKQRDELLPLLLNGQVRIKE